MGKNINIIDCTFRDGGYYTQWNFSTDLANKYLSAISKTGIQFVEIGYRRLNVKEFLGPFGFCREFFLKTLNVPKKIKLGVMINIEDVKSSKNIKNLLLKNFTHVDQSLIKFIRIATRVEDIDYAFNSTCILRKLGYLVFINLMESNSINEDKLKFIAGKINDLNKPDVFYFADTFGNLDEVKVIQLISLMSSHLKSEIGFHSHNNMSNALRNSLVAIKNNIKWLDSTILGMGRGAGNLPTEYLLINLQSQLNSQYKPEPLYPIVLEDFELLKQKYRWGESILYYLSAQKNIHPSLVQEFLSNDFYKAHEILYALNNFKSYDKSYLNNSIFSWPLKATGSCNPQKFLHKKSVLILANGPSLGLFRNEILHLIKTHKPFVLSLNINQYISEQHIDAFIACNPSKILMDLQRFKKIKKPIVIPKKALSFDIVKAFKTNKIIDYGISVRRDVFKIDKSSCTLPNLLALSYALAFCRAGKANNIYLAGFDGYEKNDPRFSLSNIVLKHFVSLRPKIAIELITPSAYECPKNTIYSICT